MKENGQRSKPKDSLIPGGPMATSLSSGTITSALPRTSPHPLTLKQIGITADQSSKWQALANVPEEEFEKGLFGFFVNAARQFQVGPQGRFGGLL